MAARMVFGIHFYFRNYFIHECCWSFTILGGINNILILLVDPVNANISLDAVGHVYGLDIVQRHSYYVSNIFRVDLCTKFVLL